MQLIKHNAAYLLITAILTVTLPAYVQGQQFFNFPHIKLPDTFAGTPSITDSTEINTTDSIENAVLQTPASYFQEPTHRKALFQFLTSNALKKKNRNKRLTIRLYRHLANVFAKIKLYPLAMQYFSNSIDSTGNDSLQVFADNFNSNALTANENVSTQADSANYETDTTEEAESLLQPAIHFPGTPIPLNTSIETEDLPLNAISKPLRYRDIIDSYNDGKKAIAYAAVLHVKQPKSGSRKAFTGLDNVGHMFITLIKYNSDYSSVSRSFGFYPHKNNLLAATPLLPLSPSVFKDDAQHDWDESIGKFISHRRYKKIIRLIGRYNKKHYHLNRNNCTDFGLNAAAALGIEIKMTTGKWLLGSGNNPANTGQSMMEGKFINTDTQTREGLFICNYGSNLNKED